MKLKPSVMWRIFVVFCLGIGIEGVGKAEISLYKDLFTVGGFLRYELGVHAADKNDNLSRNHDLSLARSMFQTEWTYKPTDQLKLFSKVRIMSDQTEQWDGDLDSYDAFPLDVASDDWTLLKTGDDDFRAEIWELYGDVNLGNLWLRLGRQQIVWGEMIGIRVLDIINPLDLSWNLFFEPEEFENIRIPIWSIRANYVLGQQSLGFLRDLSIEGFVTPGDVIPTQNPSYGSPFTLEPNLPFLRYQENDKRGNTEYGVRLGGMVGGCYVSLNYLSLYDDEAKSKFIGLTPDPIFGLPLRAPFDFTPYAVILSNEYERIDVYGITINNAWGKPFDLVGTFEGTWIPNQPYGDAMSPSVRPDITDQGTFKYGISLTRNTRVLPATFLHADFMSNTLQFTQTVVEGDEDAILGTGSSKIDKTTETIYFSMRQPLLYGDLTINFEVYYDPDDAYLLKPRVSYAYGDHWYFDVFSVFLGGAEDRPKRFGNMSWADTVYGRITYQF